MADLIYTEDTDIAKAKVTQGSLYEEDGKLVTLATMPPKVLNAVMDEVHHRRNTRVTTNLGIVGGTIPIVLHHEWRKEWRNGPRQWGVRWATFLKRKLNSAEYSKLRFMDL